MCVARSTERLFPRASVCSVGRLLVESDFDQSLFDHRCYNCFNWWLIADLPCQFVWGLCDWACAMFGWSLRISCAGIFSSTARRFRFVCVLVFAFVFFFNLICEIYTFFFMWEFWLETLCFFFLSKSWFIRVLILRLFNRFEL